MKLKHVFGFLQTANQPLQEQMGDGVKKASHLICCSHHYKQQILFMSEKLICAIALQLMACQLFCLFKNEQLRFFNIDVRPPANCSPG